MLHRAEFVGVQDIQVVRMSGASACGHGGHVPERHRCLFAAYTRLGTAEPPHIQLVASSCFLFAEAGLTRRPEPPRGPTELESSPTEGNTAVIRTTFLQVLTSLILLCCWLQAEHVRGAAGLRHATVPAPVLHLVTPMRFSEVLCMHKRCEFSASLMRSGPQRPLLESLQPGLARARPLEHAIALSPVMGVRTPAIVDPRSMCGLSASRFSFAGALRRSGLAEHSRENACASSRAPSRSAVRTHS